MKFEDYKIYDKNVMSIIIDYKTEMEWFEYRIQKINNWTILNNTQYIPTKFQQLYQKYKNYNYCMTCGIASNNGYVKDLGASWIVCKDCYLAALDLSWNNHQK